MPWRSPTAPWRSSSWVVRGLCLALAAVAAATAIGLAVLWPRDRLESPPTLAGQLTTEAAEVVAVGPGPCQGAPEQICPGADVELGSGPDAGGTFRIYVPDRVDLDAGDDVRVFRTTTPGTAGDATVTYSFSDFERRLPLALLGLAFAALVLLVARWQGLRALVGLALSLALVLFFIVPAILEGSSAVAVAVVGALAVMLLTVPVAHGLGSKAVAACLGTSASLLIVLGLAEASISAMRLGGLASEEAAVVGAVTSEISLQGLLLAGMVIGALGVLDDLTVSQASTVGALRAANPALGARALAGRAMAVGRDHITATVNTLVLAYVGASLPIFLIFSLADVPLGQAINGEVVAVEIVAMLVGSIGIVAAVPITTWIAAVMAIRQEPEAMAAGSHVH